MTYSLVQSKAASGNSGSTASATFTTPTTIHNHLVLIVDAGKNPGDVTFTPPAGWLQAGTTQHDDIFIAISGAAYYYPDNPGGITAVSTTISTTVSAWHVYLLEFSGVTTTSPLDVQSVRVQSGTTTPSSGAVTTTAAGDLLVGFICEDDVNGAYTLTQPGGWTALARNQDANQWSSQYIAWKTAGAAGTEAYAPTLTSTATDSVIGVLAFLAAGGGGGTINGGGALVANSVLAETGAEIVNPNAPVQANSALRETTAQVVNPSAAIQSNSDLATSGAEIVVPSAPIVANSMLAEASAQVTNAGAELQANGELALALGAQIVLTSAPFIANSALSVTPPSNPNRLHGTTVVRANQIMGVSQAAQPFTGVTKVRTTQQAALVGATTVRGG